MDVSFLTPLGAPMEPRAADDASSQDGAFEALVSAETANVEPSQAQANDASEEQVDIAERDVLSETTESGADRGESQSDANAPSAPTSASPEEANSDAWLEAITSLALDAQGAEQADTQVDATSTDASSLDLALTNIALASTDTAGSAAASASAPVEETVVAIDIAPADATPPDSAADLALEPSNATPPRETSSSGASPTAQATSSATNTLANAAAAALKSQETQTASNAQEPQNTAPQGAAEDLLAPPEEADEGQTPQPPAVDTNTSRRQGQNEGPQPAAKRETNTALETGIKLEPTTSSQLDAPLDDALWSDTAGADTADTLDASLQASRGAANLAPGSLGAAGGPTAMRIDTAGLASLAMRVAQGAEQGSTRFEVQLDPPELGRVDVRLEVDKQGKASAHLVVERPEALAELSRNSRQLERALAEAGVELNEDGLEFSLADENGADANDADGSGGSGGAGDGEDANGGTLAGYSANGLAEDLPLSLAGPVDTLHGFTVQSAPRLDLSI